MIWLEILYDIVITLVIYLAFPFSYLYMYGKVSNKKAHKFALTNSIVCAIICVLIVVIVSKGNAIANLIPAVTYYFIAKGILTDKNFKEEEVIKFKDKTSKIKKGEVHMKYCPNCGTANAEDAKFCTSCGKQLEEHQPTLEAQNESLNQANLSSNNQPVEAKPKYSGKAIASFVLSLVGMFIAGMICGILGVIFSAGAMQEIKAKPATKGKGLAVAGLVISIIDIVFMVIYYTI